MGRFLIPNITQFSQAAAAGGLTNLTFIATIVTTNATFSLTASSLFTLRLTTNGVGGNLAAGEDSINSPSTTYTFLGTNFNQISWTAQLPQGISTNIYNAEIDIFASGNPYPTDFFISQLELTNH